MKTTSRFAIATAFAAFASTGVMAADLGGNCCSDLEERIAELEATTARKGNRKVSLEVSGFVHEGILIWDDGFDNAAYIHTPNSARSRFRFKGSAKIDSDWSAGFLIEIGLRETGNSSSFNQDALTNSGLDIRHQALYLKSNRLGTVWLGHTSLAVDGVSDICLGCPVTSSHWSALTWGGMRIRNADGDFGTLNPTWNAIGAGNLTTSNGSRDQILRYISPELGGFVFSADTQLDESSSDDARWSIALRYANEFNGVRFAGGAGYFEEDIRDGWGLSASMQHVATGLFIAGTYEEEKDAGVFVAGGRDTHSAWSVTGGLARKFSPLGATTFWVKYAEYDGHNASVDTALDSFSDSEVLSLGINQKIDAAAMEVYVSYYHVSGDVNFIGGPSVAISDFNAVLMGARIQF